MTLAARLIQIYTCTRGKVSEKKSFQVRAGRVKMTKQGWDDKTQEHQDLVHIKVNDITFRVDCCGYC